jgi:hypothetical protein
MLPASKQIGLSEDATNEMSARAGTPNQQLLGRTCVVGQEDGRYWIAMNGQTA